MFRFYPVSVALLQGRPLAVLFIEHRRRATFDVPPVRIPLGIVLIIGVARNEGRVEAMRLHPGLEVGGVFLYVFRD